MSYYSRNNLTYTQHGVPKYSQRFKDVLYRFYKQHQKKQTQKSQIQLKFNFLRIKLLGIGAHSMVNVVLEQKSRTLFAQKIIKKQSKIEVNQLSAQIKIHLYLSHKNLIKLYHCYSDSENLYLLMQLGQESLFAMKNRGVKFQNSQILKIMKQIVAGIGYMHGQGLVHGDLKLQNVVKTVDETIKICDFGYTHKAYEPLTTQIVGTLQYLPPEYVQGRDSGFKRDIWAIGMILYELITGSNPLEKLAQDQQWLTLLKFEQNNQNGWEVPDALQGFQIFLARTLCKVDQRASCIQLERILQSINLQQNLSSSQVQNNIIETTQNEHHQANASSIYNNNFSYSTHSYFNSQNY